MAGLPKKYIKKYGVSKRAWAEYRKTKKSKSSVSRSVKAPKKRRTYTMAKRKTSYRRKKSGNPMLNKALGAFGYGLVREWTSNKLQPLTDKVPLGEVSDEGVMLGINYLLAKGKIPVLNKVDMLKKVGEAGFLIEAARLGQYVVTKVGNSSPSSSGSSIF